MGTRARRAVGGVFVAECKGRTEKTKAVKKTTARKEGMHTKDEKEKKCVRLVSFIRSKAH
jgi:hypothetical protein